MYSKRSGRGAGRANTTAIAVAGGQFAAADAVSRPAYLVDNEQAVSVDTMLRNLFGDLSIDPGQP